MIPPKDVAEQLQMVGKYPSISEEEWKENIVHSMETFGCDWLDKAMDIGGNVMSEAVEALAGKARDLESKDGKKGHWDKLHKELREHIAWLAAELEAKDKRIVELEAEVQGYENDICSRCGGKDKYCAECGGDNG